MILLKLRAAWALLKRVPWQVWLVVAVLLTGWLWGNHRYSQGWDAREAKYEAQAAKDRARAESANAAAAEQRIEDVVRNINEEKERNDAIDQAVPFGAPSQAPDDANRALACYRLRAAGLHAAAAKAGCRGSN